MSQRPSRRLSWGLTAGLAAHSKDDAPIREEEENDNDDETSSTVHSSAEEDEACVQADNTKDTTATTASQPDVAASSAQSIQYDGKDTTRAFTDAVPPRMIVLPRALLPVSVQAALDNSNNNNNNSSDSSSPALRETAVNVGGDHTTACQPPHDATGACAAATLPALEPYDEENGGVVLPGVDFVQLPHPRHQQPALFLCRDTAHATQGDTSAARDDEPCVYEIQAQDPPGGFAQTWCVDDVVIPGSSQLLVSTPFDVTFFALRELLDAQARSRGSFQPVTQLFCDSDAQHVRHGQRGAEEADEDSVHERGSNNNDNNMTSEEAWWSGWAAAVHDCPALLPCYTRMQSHAVLARLCEVRSLGAGGGKEDDVAAELTRYYRYDEKTTIEWLLAKIRKVEHSDVLAELLQLPAPGERARTRDELEALRMMAFHLVIEYVPECLHAVVAQRYGLDAELASIEPKAAGQTNSGGGGGGDTAQTRHATGGATVSAGEKRKADMALARTSARRLEKAGRPKGTPTLFAMFAQQQQTQAQSKTRDEATKKETSGKQVKKA